jgi:type 1 glutamine amidotransferase
MSKLFNVLTIVIFLQIYIPFKGRCADMDKAGINISVKKKVVFVAGKDSHGRGEHEFRAGCHLLARLLNENTAEINAVVIEDGWPADQSVFDDADVIVMYSDGAESHMAIPHLSEIDKLVKRGVGMVAMHYAVEVPAGEPANYFISWFGGYFEAFYSVNPSFIPVLEALPKHPITNGVKLFQLKDEWYYHLRFADLKKITPILTTHPPLSTLEPQPRSIRGNNEFVKKDLENGKLQTLAWAFERPNGGRSFGFNGGHYHSNWANDDFRKLVLNAIVDIPGCLTR